MKKINVVQKGFTLIELVIVMVILGILAAIAAPQFTDMSGNAKARAREGAVAAVNSALSIYVADQVAQGNSSAPYPTVANLAAKLTPAGDSATTVGSIVVGSGGNAITIATYPTSDCTGTANSAAASLVKCAK